MARGNTLALCIGMAIFSKNGRLKYRLGHLCIYIYLDIATAILGVVRKVSERGLKRLGQKKRQFNWGGIGGESGKEAPINGRIKATNRW